MKLNFIGFLILAAFSSCGPERMTGWETEGLKGEVRRVQVTSFRPDSSVESVLTNEFGVDGKMESLEIRASNSYSRWVTDPDELGYPKETRILDSAGNVLEKIIYSRSETKDSTALTYACYQKEVKNNFGTTWYFNKRLVKDARYDPDGNLMYRFENQYDESGNLTRQTLFVQNQPPARVNFQYREFDEKGNWISRDLIFDGQPDPARIEKRKIYFYR